MESRVMEPMRGSSMETQDAAVSFTLNYLELLEKHLGVSWSDEGLPFCIVDWIGKDSIENLRADLAALMQGDLRHEAIRATIEYGAEHVQTVGFGLAPDFDQFIRLGMIYGERVVLWDVVHSRIFADGRPDRDRKSLLAQIACNLLKLREVARRGAVVILPHPIVWSRAAAELDAELRASGPVPAASLGLSMAFAAIEEGMQLHPYALLEGGSRPQAATKVDGRVDELFSRENFMFQKCVTNLLRDKRLAHLDDVGMEDFLDVVSKDEKFRRALRAHFTAVLSGLSTAQAAKEASDRTDELFDLFKKAKAASTDYVAEGIDATGKLALVSLSLVSIGQPLLSALAALGTSAFYLSAAVRKWARKPEKNAIVLAFEALDQSDRSREPVHLHDMEYHVSSYRRGQSELGAMFETFMSLYWTEEKHHYLESLPPDVARALLAALTANELEIIVNYRKFQEDYIGDYLAYLSTLDEAIYWAHLGKTFAHADGLLIYDDDAHIVSMETRDMPLETWQQLLDSLFEAYASQMRSQSYGYPLERFPAIVRFQTEQAKDADKKRSALNALASSLAPSDREALSRLLAEAFDGDAPAWFAGA